MNKILMTLLTIGLVSMAGSSFAGSFTYDTRSLTTQQALTSIDENDDLVRNVSLSCYSLGIRTNTQYECEYYVGHYTKYPLANWRPSTECRGCNP